MPAWCSSRTFPRRREAALPARRRPRRNACAPAASTTTSKMSATPRAITRSSRCSAISRSATISRRARSSSPGTWSPRNSGCPRTGCWSPSIPRTTRLRALAEDRRTARGAHHPHRRPRTISGRWATPARAARARRSSTTTARTFPAARPAAPDEDGDRFIEIWNLVFMQFEQVPGGERVDSAAAVDRHRHGARAHRRGAAGQARQLRHRPVPRADPASAEASTGVTADGPQAARTG